MCPALLFTIPSMYLSARSAIGSRGVSLPLRRRPVNTTPVTPGLLLVLHPPFSSWVLLRYTIARATVVSQVLLAAPSLATGLASKERAVHKPATATIKARPSHDASFMGI